jgi:hypothetical protein
VTEESTNLSSKNPWTEEIATSTPLAAQLESSQRGDDDVFSAGTAGVVTELISMLVISAAL